MALRQDGWHCEKSGARGGGGTEPEQTSNRQSREGVGWSGVQGTGSAGGGSTGALNEGPWRAEEAAAAGAERGSRQGSAGRYLGATWEKQGGEGRYCVGEKRREGTGRAGMGQMAAAGQPAPACNNRVAQPTQGGNTWRGTMF